MQKMVAKAMKAEGWEFASHTWGHKDVAATSLDDLKRDDKKMEEICGSHTWRNRYDHFCIWCGYRKLGRIFGRQ